MQLNKSIKAKELHIQKAKVLQDIKHIVEGDMNAVIKWLYHLPAETYLKLSEVKSNVK